MRQDVTDQAGGLTLFREKATRSAASRSFGSVTVVVPPSGLVTLTVGILALLMLGFVAWYVEIPQRARAVGVLMPPDGLLDVVASAPGRVVKISVAEGQSVKAGDSLLNITTDRQQLVLLQLQSLRTEIALLGEAQVRQVALDHSRSLALDEHLDSINRQLDVAQDEYELHRHQVALLERRLMRRQGLASNGNLSADLLDQEHTSMLQARARGTAMRRVMLEYEQDAAAILRARSEALHESERQQILHDLDHRRLQRQIDEHEYLIDQVIKAPEAGAVARISVRPGAAVRAGDTLVKIYRPNQGLEAWLYLPSASAGFLRAGQVVQLRLDAYPYQLFGTSTAVVTSISSTAIVPTEIRVPLALTGPVFEVRARLDDTHINAFNAIWPLAPGTSFQADLVQRRYRLYEWLLRAVVTGSGEPRA